MNNISEENQKVIEILVLEKRQLIKDRKHLESTFNWHWSAKEIITFGGEIEKIKMKISLRKKAIKLLKTEGNLDNLDS